VTKRKPTPVDLAVGRNVRIYRLQRGISQSDLADRVGVTFQQIQKYESGTNRISAARLTQIAQVFGVELPALFDGIARDGGGPPGFPGQDFLLQPLSLRLLQAFEQIESGALQGAILAMIDALAVRAPPSVEAVEAGAAFAHASVGAHGEAAGVVQSRHNVL